MRDVREIILTSDIKVLTYYIDYMEQLIEMCEKRELKCVKLRDDKIILEKRYKEVMRKKRKKSEDKL